MRALRLAAMAAALTAIGLAAWLAAMREPTFQEAAARWFRPEPMPAAAMLPAPARWRLVLAALAWALPAAVLAAWPRASAAAHKGLVQAWRCARDSVAQAWGRLPRWERGWVIAAAAACTALRAGSAWHDPPLLDEALNWTLFSGRGPLAALASYAAPNNHILYSACAALLGLLPVDPLLALRLPAVIGAGAAQAALHLLLRRVAGPGAASLALAAALASPLFLLYDHLGRGYAWVALAAVGAFGAALRWRTARDARALALLAIACAAGTFTMPSFLYLAAALFAALLLAGEDRRRVLRAGAWFASGALLAHAPALIASGSGAFFLNRWMHPVPIAEVARAWGPHLVRSFQGLLGLKEGLMVGAAVLALAAAWARPEAKRAASLSLAACAIAIALPFAHARIPFERSWIFLLAPLSVSMAAVLQRAAASWRRQGLLIPLGAGLFLLQLHRARALFPALEAEAFSAREACASLRASGAPRVLAEPGPLAAQVLFDAERGRQPAVAGFSFCQEPPCSASPGTAVIGAWTGAGPLDLLIHAAQGPQAIWIADGAARP